MQGRVPLSSSGPPVVLQGRILLMRTAKQKLRTYTNLDYRAPCEAVRNIRENTYLKMVDR